MQAQEDEPLQEQQQEEPLQEQQEEPLQQQQPGQQAPPPQGAVDEIGKFYNAATVMIEEAKGPEFEKRDLHFLYEDIGRLGYSIFPRIKHLNYLREMIARTVDHEFMEGLAIAFEKYMDLLYPKYVHSHVHTSEDSGYVSIDLMNLVMALRFLIVEYFHWSDAKSVNEEGRQIMIDCVDRYHTTLLKIRSMINTATYREDKAVMFRTASTIVNGEKLLERILDDQELNPVKETLLEDFFAKRAREDIWKKLYESPAIIQFTLNNPSGNVCSYCLDRRVDSGDDIAITNACSDLYCVRCAKTLGFALGGDCANLECKEKVTTYVVGTTYKAFMEEVESGDIGPYEEVFVKEK